MDYGPSSNLNASKLLNALITCSVGHPKAWQSQKITQKSVQICPVDLLDLFGLCVSRASYSETDPRLGFRGFHEASGHGRRSYLEHWITKVPTCISLS